jgi:hypothetical protein
VDGWLADKRARARQATKQWFLRQFVKLLMKIFQPGKRF